MVSPLRKIVYIVKLAMHLIKWNVLVWGETNYMPIVGHSKGCTNLFSKGITIFFLEFHRCILYIRRIGGGTYCWVQAYFEKEIYFGCRPSFGEKFYFGKDLILERRPNFGAHARGKEACKRRSNVAHKKESLTMIGLGVLINIVTTISL
jgi:hypothetical protein